MRKIPREIQNLETSYNNIREYLDQAFIIIDKDIALETQAKNENYITKAQTIIPMNYKEAINNEDAEKWKIAMNEGISRMMERKVW